MRAQTGAASRLGFTGEQHDATTGAIYLRARTINPALGRFLSADSVQPNAPGTQGYNRYSYVANNPTTWIDPTGHQAQAVGWKLNPQWMLIGSLIARYYLAACIAQPLGCAVIAALIIVAFILVSCVLGGFDGACYLPGAVPTDPPSWWDDNRTWDVPLPWVPDIPIPFTDAPAIPDIQFARPGGGNEQRPPKAVCNKAIKLLKDAVRLLEKHGRRISEKQKAELRRKIQDGTISSYDLPGIIQRQFPGEFEGKTLREIEKLCGR